MNDSKNPAHIMSYIIVGLLVLIVIVNILSGLLQLISYLASAVLTLLLVIAVGYVIYILMRSMFRNE